VYFICRVVFLFFHFWVFCIIYLSVSPCYNRNLKIKEFLFSSQIEAFCQKYHIRSLAVFGSAVREDFSPQSDIDILVEFETGKVPGFEFFLMEDELTRLVGRKVDLQTLNFLSPEIREQVLSEAVPAYEQT